MKRTEAFPNLRKRIPATPRPAEGGFYIEHFDVDEHQSSRTTLHGGLDYVPPGSYIALKKAGRGNASWDTLWMSDTLMERQTNYDAVREGRGDVLIGGLGLGMVALALCQKPEVRSVTVLEIEPRVVALVGPYLRHPKLRILVADVNAPPLRGRGFDYIYLDIWPNICSDNWPEMKSLLATYRRFLRPGGHADGWMKEYIQEEHCRSAREERNWYA